MNLLFILLLLVTPIHAIITASAVNPGVFTASEVGEGDDYADITFYHDAEALDNANYGADSVVVSYNSGILITSGDGIVGESWDNNNDGFDKISVTQTIDYAGGRIGFYWEPQEVAAGRIAWGNNDDWYIEYVSASTTRFRYQGTTNDKTTTFSIGVQYFIELKFTGSNMEIFIDGVSKGTVAGTGTADDTLRLFSNDGNAWDAYIDQVFMSNDETRDLNAIRTCTDCHP